MPREAHDELTQSASLSGASPSDERSREPRELRLVAVGDYELGRELAKGGMGVVVEARDRRHDRVVAIKRPLHDDPGHLERFMHEARLAAQLQHPGIVPVYEAGRLPTGEPFIAMKHVEGQNLRQTVAACTTFAERLALLPRLIAVADALAYAHGRGVVHRDLTPSNVLIGHHGETLVIDWGVATEVGAPGDDSSPGVPRSNSTDGPVGTRRYAAPEQARGERVDARADVYSFGAVLYFTLSGRPPEPTPSDTPPLPTVERDLPPELGTIVARCMAADASDRYPSAGELADDLKRLLAGELVRAHDYSTRALLRRWAQRRRGVLIAVLVAVVAVVTIGLVSLRRIAKERDAALAAERRATQLSDSGRHLVGFLLESLYKKLLAIGRLDALEGLASEVQHYYTALSDDAQGDSSALLAQVGALTILGDVEMDQEKLVDARAAYVAASDILQRRQTRFGVDGLGQHHVARVEMRLGDVDRSDGHEADATRHFMAGLAAAQAALATPQGDDSDTRMVGLLQMRIGDQLRTAGDLDGARARFLAIVESTAGHTDDKSLWMRGWGQVRVAEADSLLGKGALARREIGEAIATRRLLLQHVPTNLSYQQDLASSEGMAGDIDAHATRFVDALAHYRAAAAILAGPVAAEPTNAVLSFSLASAEDGACSALNNLRRVTEATTTCQRAVSIQEPFAKSTIARRQLVEACGNAAAALDEAGDYTASLRMAQHGLEVGKALLADAADWNSIADTVQAQLIVAQEQVRLRRFAEAIATVDAATHAIDADMAANPSVGSLRQYVVTAWRMSGWARQQAGQRAAAITAYRRAIDSAGTAVDDPEVELEVMFAHVALGVLGDAASQKRGEAMAAARRARGLFGPLEAWTLAQIKAGR